MNDPILLFVFIASIALNMGLAIYGWQHRQLQGAAAFSVAMFLFAMLPVAQFIDQTSSDLPLKVIALKSRVETAGIGATAWLIMIMQLTGHTRLIHWRLLLTLSVIPLLMLVLNWSENPLFRSNYFLDSSGILHWNTGPVFWIGLVYLNLVLLIPLYLIWRSYRNVSPLSLKQSLALSVAGILPILFNVLFQLKILTLQGVNFPFAAGPLMGLLVIWSVFQFRLFDLIPVARGLLIESMSDGVLVLDNANRIVDVNPAMQQMLGFTSEEMLGRNANSIFAFWPDLMDRFWRVPEITSELFIDGDSPHYLDLRISPLTDQRGQQAGRLVVVRDITESKVAEIERDRLIDELKNKNAELERFTYTVSHDLKAPLFTIQGFVGYLERDIHANKPEKIQEDIDHVLHAIDKMQQLLNELLELSRIGRIINPPQEISLSVIAQDAVNLVAGHLTKKHIQVVIAPDLPVVYCDRVRITQVLQNLIDNAVKFMGEQPEPKIWIGQRIENNEAIFFVRDNGIGILPENQDRIFGLFDKLDKKAEGTGIGLALVKRIIETHGGKIWVESEGLNKGSIFCFTFLDPQEG